eukprot:1150583-Pelagomonas_calceolata.AAC.6
MFRPPFVVFQGQGGKRILSSFVSNTFKPTNAVFVGAMAREVKVTLAPLLRQACIPCHPCLPTTLPSRCLAFSLPCSLAALPSNFPVAALKPFSNYEAIACTSILDQQPSQGAGGEAAAAAAAAAKWPPALSTAATA